MVNLSILSVVKAKKICALVAGESSFMLMGIYYGTRRTKVGDVTQVIKNEN